MKKICVRDSDLSQLMDDVAYNNLFLCDRELSNLYWSEIIGTRSRSYFQLPDDHWVVKNLGDTVAFWRCFFFKNKYNLFAEKLLNTINFPLQEYVFFLANIDNVFICTWEIFLNNWDSLLAVYDDCPILFLGKNEHSKALIFTPMGKVRVSACRHISTVPVL